jgi:hypothetical protein
MDHTPIDQLLFDLDGADPADAPSIADVLASRLSDELDTDAGVGTASSA